MINKITIQWFIVLCYTTLLTQVSLAQVRYIENKARPSSEINQIFPYDIPLKNMQGDSVNSASVLDNKGKPIVISFWLTTCYPCRVEMKNIQKHYHSWIEETGIRIVFISTDFEHNAHKIKPMMEKAGYEYEVYHDIHKEFSQILPGGLNGLPQTFLIDDNGEILYHKRKYSSGDEFKLYEAMKKAANL
jgi:peroxiredoxin